MYPGIPSASRATPTDHYPVYFIVMTGRFTAYGASIPLGAHLATGTQLHLVIDMQGRTTDWGITDLPEPDLAQAGRVVRLNQ